MWKPSFPSTGFAGIIVLLSLCAVGAVTIFVTTDYDDIDQSSLYRVNDSLFTAWQDARHDWKTLEHYLLQVRLANNPKSDSLTRQTALRGAIAHRDSLRLKADSTERAYEAFQRTIEMLRGETDSLHQVVP